MAVFTRQATGPLLSEDLPPVPSEEHLDEYLKALRGAIGFSLILLAVLLAVLAVLLWQTVG